LHGRKSSSSAPFHGDNDATQRQSRTPFAAGPASHQGREEARKGGEEKGYCLSGRRYGSLERNFKLPEGIDTDKIEARFVKGVL
jgi:HSP20 family protein